MACVYVRKHFLLLRALRDLLAGFLVGALLVASLHLFSGRGLDIAVTAPADSLDLVHPYQWEATAESYASAPAASTPNDLDGDGMPND